MLNLGCCFQPSPFQEKTDLFKNPKAVSVARREREEYVLTVSKYCLKTLHNTVKTWVLKMSNINMGKNTVICFVVILVHL